MEKYSLQITPFGRNATLCFESHIKPDSESANGGLLFTHDILTRADSIINFANYDANGDHIVDAVFLIIVNTVYPPNGTTLAADFITNDSVGGQPIIIVGADGRTGGNGAAVYANDGSWALRISCHEWGHVLGLGDFYQNNGVTWWNLGSFTLMGTGFPFNRPVPLDPYHRILLGWVDPIEVTGPLYQQSIPDYLTSGTVYKLSKDSNQYFLITNHQGVNPNVDPRGQWEAALTRNGLLIWHIDKTGEGGQQFHKLIDVELAHGLWNLNPTTCVRNDTIPNPVSGKDSLDCAWCNPPNPPPPCQRKGYPSDKVQSATCFWPQPNKVNFDGLSNPSSDAYRDSVVGGIRIQNIPTHLAVRGISASQFQSATADLLVNNWGGPISQNTTWSGTVLITEDVTVDQAVGLTASPGTIIKVANGKKLIIKGTFTCLGTQTDSIILTSISASPTNGDWGGVVIDTFGRANIEFTRFSYADTALAVRGDTATVVVYNSTFSHFTKAAVSSRSAKTRLGGIVPVPNPPDCGRNNFLMNTATSGAKAVIKSSQPVGTLKAEGNYWDAVPPPSSYFSGSVDRTPYLTGVATPDSCGSGQQFSGPPPEVRVTAISGLPVSFELGQNYPNPFNPTTTIQYALPEPAQVELKIFNTLGQVVRTLVDEHQGAGYHHVIWDGKDEAGRTVSTGVYLYQIKAGDFVKTMKMSFIK